MTEIQQFKLLSTSSSMMELVKRPVEKVTEALRKLPTNIHGILPSGVKAALALPLSLVRAEAAIVRTEGRYLPTSPNSNTFERVEVEVVISPARDSPLQRKITNLKDTVTDLKDSAENAAASIKTIVGTPIATGINVIKLPLASGIAKAKQAFKEFLGNKPERFFTAAQNASQKFQNAGKQAYETGKEGAKLIQANIKEAMGTTQGGKTVLQQEHYDNHIRGAQILLQNVISSVHDNEAEFKTSMQALKKMESFKNITSNNPQQNQKMNKLVELGTALMSSTSPESARGAMNLWAVSEVKLDKTTLHETLPFATFPTIAGWSESRAALAKVDSENRETYQLIADSAHLLKDALDLASNPKATFDLARCFVDNKPILKPSFTEGAVDVEDVKFELLMLASSLEKAEQKLNSIDTNRDTSFSSLITSDVEIMKATIQQTRAYIAQLETSWELTPAAPQLASAPITNASAPSENSKGMQTIQEDLNKIRQVLDEIISDPDQYEFKDLNTLQEGLSSIEGKLDTIEGDEQTMAAVENAKSFIANARADLANFGV